MKRVLFALLAAAAVSTPAMANQALAQSKNCLSCHQIDTKVVGPAYKDVAKKYAGDKTAEAKLTEKIQKGGAGVWGTMSMPPNPQVSPAEAKTLAHWILGLK